ncbi:hypothetical protein [Paenalcaligenes suwonensis]|uniref:hypothetical protein n=1 Tax=Paenalcaligenes suwonensis TaxID=1202713 RepID=UPI00140DB3E2|nr:hypothetical protein [Paenalcaligenes suwonensis]NHC63272.1 hypothetical protein [Paenalcaligenes suwonensis]
MSNVKKPEPVAWRIEHPHPLFRTECTIDKLVAAHWQQVADAEVVPLFGEDYINERVREALEQAASICDRFADRGMHPAECAGAIRALIPKQ